MDEMLTPEELQHALVYYNKGKVERHIAALEEQLAAVVEAWSKVEPYLIGNPKKDNQCRVCGSLSALCKDNPFCSRAKLSSILADLPEATRQMLARLEAAHGLMTSTHWFDQTGRGVKCRICLGRGSDVDTIQHNGPCPIEAYLKAREGADAN